MLLEIAQLDVPPRPQPGRDLRRVEGSEEALPLLADAQTSGGLLVALPEGAVDDYIARVPSSTRVGVVTDRQGVVEVA